MDKITLQEFWTLVLDVWNNGLYGIDVGKIIAALLIIYISMLFRHLFSRIVLGRLRALTKKTKSIIDDEVIDVIEKPVGFLPIVIGIFFATEILNLTGNLAEGADNLNRSLITFNIFWAFYNVIGPLSLTFGKLKDIFSSSMINWLIKAMHGLF